MKKKARFYLGFFICSGERVKTVFTCLRVFLSLICTNAGTRINTGFFVHSLISISQAVRDRTGQVTNAALGRRSWLRDASPKARAQVRWRQVKVLPAFSKGRYVPVGRCPAADRGGSREAGCRAQFAGGKRSAPTEPAGETGALRSARGAGPLRPGGTFSSGRPSRQARPVGPAFPYSQKGGTDVPLLGWHRARGFCLWKGRAGWHRDRSRGYRPLGACAPSAAFFHRLRRVKVKAARRCLALCKPLKRLERNFSLSLSHPSAAPYTMRNKGWLNSTTWPLPTQISATVPSTSAGISFISFMASIIHRVSPFFTWSPTSTKGRASGLGAE